MKRIVTSMLVSYDADLIKNSLPLIYSHSDRIILSIDRDRRTWSGSGFVLPDDFFAWVEHIDVQRKIEIYEDSFFVPGQPLLSLDTRQRQMTADYAGCENTWHVQVDADEYVLNFGALVQYLRDAEDKHEDSDSVLHMGKCIPLFKQDQEGFYYVDNGRDYELVALAASRPHYKAARKIDSTERKVVDVYVVHQTFARTASELKKKFSSWGHANDFNTDSYLKMWEAVDRYNCSYLSNFHPSYAPTWKRLAYLEALNIEEFLGKYKEHLESVHDVIIETKRKRITVARLLKGAAKRLERFAGRLDRN